MAENALRDEWLKLRGKWLKSKAGTWHRYGGAQGADHIPIAMCASYNLDRPNYLGGEAVRLEEIPVGQRICKKCLSHEGES